MEKRTVSGKWVPTGDMRDTWHCATCKSNGNTGTSVAPDGEKGLWCHKCSLAGVKSALTTIQVPDERYVRGWTEVKCCDEWLCCSHFTNTCPHCETDYNGSGQQLAPREFWGEETGETASDILNLE